MVENTVLKKIREEGRSFFKAVSCANETVYLILLSLYVAIYFLLKFGWAVHMYRIDEYIRYSLLGIVMWGSAIYLFYVIASWRSMWEQNIQLIVTAVLILAATWFFSKRMSTNLYGVIMDVFFCVMACGKDFRKMLHCILMVAVVMLVIAGMGLPLGYTWDMVKPHNVSPGHSLGINYPNTWGYLAFLAMMITWYLYLRFRPGTVVQTPGLVVPGLGAPGWNPAIGANRLAGRRNILGGVAGNLHHLVVGTLRPGLHAT